jgi:octaprenyl-diphosphate synthase
LTKRRVIYQVKNNKGKNEIIAKVIEFVRQSGGLEYAIGQMNTYADEALAILRSFAPSPSRTSLELLITYTIEREK